MAEMVEIIVDGQPRLVDPRVPLPENVERARRQTEEKKAAGEIYYDEELGEWVWGTLDDGVPYTLPWPEHGAPGWYVSEQVWALADMAGGSGHYGTMTYQTFDNQGNPITVVSIDDHGTGLTGWLTPKGEVEWIGPIGTDLVAAAGGPARIINVPGLGGGDEWVIKRWGKRLRELGKLPPEIPIGQGTKQQNDAFQYLAELLASYGLGELAPWVWGQILEGRSNERIIQELRQQDAYKRRFRAIIERSKNGLVAMSEAEVLEYETAARQMMRAAGLPAGFYDQPEDFVNFMANDVSLAELSDRVTEGFARAMAAPQEVRDAFENLLGGRGIEALAMAFLDPDRAWPQVERMFNTAQVQGAGRMFGVDVSEQTAGRLTEVGIGFDEARQGFATLQQNEAIFRETASESTDLTAEGEGVDAVFGLGGGGLQQIERRVAQRQAAFAGGGGAARTRQGYGL